MQTMVTVFKGLQNRLQKKLSGNIPLPPNLKKGKRKVAYSSNVSNKLWWIFSTLHFSTLNVDDAFFDVELKTSANKNY